MLRPVVLYLSRAFYGVALLAVSALIARAWGAEGLGVYSALMTVLNLAVVFCVFGADIRFIEQSPKRARRLGTDYDVAAHRGEALTLVLMQSLIILPFALIAIKFASPTMEVVTVSVIFMGLAQMFGNILISAGHQVINGLIMQVLRPLLLLGALALAATIGASLRIALMIGISASFAIVIVCCLPVVKVSRPTIQIVLSGLTAEWWKASLVFVFMAVYNILFVQADRLIILQMSGAADAGLYAAAQNILNLVNYAVNAIMTLAMPLISQGFSGDMSPSSLSIKLRKLSRPLWIFSLTVIPAFAIFGQQVFSLYGDGFSESITPLLILSIGLSGGLVFGFPITVLTLSEHKQLLIWGSLVSLSFTLLLSIILISHYGLVGAAISHAISNIGSRAGFHILCVRRTGVSSSIF